jgi:hypothetical protein
MSLRYYCHNKLLNHVPFSLSNVLTLKYRFNKGADFHSAPFPFFETPNSVRTEQNLTQRKAFMPAGHLGTKRMGELAELGFTYRAAAYGIGIARPYGDSHPYDLLTQHGRRLLHIQVKSCFSEERRGCTGFPIIVACHWGQGRMHYTIDDVDFIAAFVAKYDAWYLIPMESLGSRKNIRVYPGKKRPKSGGMYEQFREAWNLLLDAAYAEKKHYTSKELLRLSGVEEVGKENTA